jgi:hypothetical protein
MNVLDTGDDIHGPSFSHLVYIGRRWLREFFRLLLRSMIQAFRRARLGHRRKGGVYPPLADWMREHSGKHVVLLGASTSARALEAVLKSKGKPSDLVVIGCNWTNYLDIDLDLYISAHLVMCRLAQVSKIPPSMVINPTLDGRSAGYGLEPIMRKNFGDAPEKLFSAEVGPKKVVLYTNQNVLFLMINAALAMNPCSITFCGFERTSDIAKRTHFFARDIPLMKRILDDFVSIPDMDLMAHQKGSVATEMLQVVYAYFWASLFECLSENDTRAYMVVKQDQDRLADKRERYISEFVRIAEERSIPLYRLGDTTLFSDLPVSPTLGAPSEGL